MNRWTVFFVTLLFAGLVTVGCSGGDTGPVIPDSDTGLTSGAQARTGSSNTYLWGYYDVTIDLATQQITAVPDRTTAFAANVVDFLNSNPAAMKFDMIELFIGDTEITVDLDVELSHPFDGMPQFNGYDVRGVFLGGTSDTLSYNSDLDFAVYGVDQYMMDDPINADGGGPDGFTRWFNAKEFTTPGLFGYAEGAFASKGFQPTATLNPYKYYADGIDVEDDPFEFLMANAADYAVFASGSTNTRNYYLEFPLPSPGATYGYAIVANWEDPDEHPSNAPESPAISVTVTDNIYYVDGSDNGGDLILDFDVWTWDALPTAIVIESDVMSSPYTLTPTDMIPTGGGANYSTYHVEITADSVGYNSNDTGDSFYWVICEAGGYDYKCDGLNPTGPSDTLAAVFGYPLFIANEPYNADPICDFEVVTDLTDPIPGPVEFDATACIDPDGDPVTFHWDFDDDAIYDEDPDDNYNGDPDNPTHIYTEDFSGDVNLWLEDGVGGESFCSVYIELTIFLPTSYPCTGTLDDYDSAYELTSGYTQLQAADDGCIYSIPIGFTFSYGPNDYTHFTLVRNGGLGFGSGCFSCCTPFCSSTHMANWIHAIGDDLNSGAGGMMRYQTKTVNNVQCLIMEFYNVPAYYNYGSNTFQIVLFDTPQDQFDDFRIQIHHVYDVNSDVFYRLNSSSCCLATTLTGTPKAYDIPGQ